MHKWKEVKLCLVIHNEVEVNSCLTHRFPENEQWYDKTYS